MPAISPVAYSQPAPQLPDFARRDCPFTAKVQRKRQPTNIMSVIPNLEKSLPIEGDENSHFRTDHLDNDLGGRSARGGAMTVASQGVKFISSLVASVILARLLMPEDYGLIGMVAIVINFVSLFQYMGLSTATIKWAELNHQQVSTLFWLNMALSTAIMLTMAASAPVVAWFFGEPRLIWITLGYAISIVFTGLYIQHEALLSRQMRFGALAIIEISSILLGFASAIIAAWFGAGYWALVLNQLVITLVTVVGVWVACRWRPGLPVRGSGVRSMLSYGGNLTGFNLMTYFARNLDNALIGRVWGSYQLGLYSKAYQILLMPMQQINAPFAAIAVPALSRLVDSPERYRRAYLQILEKIAMITMPGVVFMIATSDWLILLLLGPQWAGASQIFVLLGIAAVIQPVTKTCWWLFSTQGRTDDLFRWGLLGGAIAVASIIIGLPWGPVGVAASYAVSDLLISTPLLFWYVGRRGPVRAGDFYRTISPAACGAALSLVGLLICRLWLESFQHLVVRLTIAFLIAAIITFIVLSALPAGRRSLQSFKEMLFSLFKTRRDFALLSEQ
jgi:PST family polysaccharide transporter